jgi:hypothetical protein
MHTSSQCGWDNGEKYPARLEDMHGGHAIVAIPKPYTFDAHLAHRCVLCQRFRSRKFPPLASGLQFSCPVEYRLQP